MVVMSNEQGSGEFGSEPILVDGVPFNVLMQQASDLKTAQLAIDRKRYDSFPIWYRNSLFHASHQDFQPILSLSFEDRKEFVKLQREIGNAFFKRDDLTEAKVAYEKALSVWCYITSKHADWKNRAIEDQDLIEHRFQHSTTEEEVYILHDRIGLLLNLATTYNKLQEYFNAIDANSLVLQLTTSLHTLLQLPDDAPTKVATSATAELGVQHQVVLYRMKAFHRRAQARYLPVSSGTIQYMQAMKDLKDGLLEGAVFMHAHKNSAGGQLYRELRIQHDRLKFELKAQQEKDKKQFNHLFTRYKDDLSDRIKQMKDKQQREHGGANEGKSSSAMTLKDLEGIIQTLEDEIESLVLKNDIDAKVKLSESTDHFVDIQEKKALFEEDQVMRNERLEQLIEKRDHLKKILQMQRKQKIVDFQHPSKDMVRDARDLYDLDLTDPMVKNLLAKLAHTDSQGDANSAENDDLVKSIETEWYEKEGNVLAQKVIDTFKEEKDLQLLLRHRLTYEVPSSVKLNPSDSVQEQLRMLLMRDYVTSCKAFNDLNLGEKNKHKSAEEKEKSEQEAWRRVLDQLLDRYYTEHKTDPQLTPHTSWLGKSLLDNMSLYLAKFVLFVEKRTGVDKRTVFVVLIVVVAFAAFRMVVANLLRVITETYLEPVDSADIPGRTTEAVNEIGHRVQSAAMKIVAAASDATDVDQEFEF